MNIKKHNPKHFKKVYRSIYTVDDVIKGCYGICLIDKSEWINHEDGYFVNKRTHEPRSARDLYSYIALGIGFNHQIVCGRKALKRSQIEDQDLGKPGWVLRKIDFVEKEKRK